MLALPIAEQCASVLCAPIKYTSSSITIRNSIRSSVKYALQSCKQEGVTRDKYWKFYLTSAVRSQPCKQKRSSRNEGTFSITWKPVETMLSESLCSEAAFLRLSEKRDQATYTAPAWNNNRPRRATCGEPA